jgi:CheY-like chemotaxis protein
MGTLLIVEDDPTDRETRIAMLEGGKYKIEPAIDGLEAV